MSGGVVVGVGAGGLGMEEGPGGVREDGMVGVAGIVEGDGVYGG